MAELANPGARHDWQVAAVFALLLCNYLVSAPRGVLLDDDGYFVLAAWADGVAHPPGYPLYTLLAGLCAKLPLGTVAWRVHGASALCAALACALLWSIVRRLTASGAAAWAAALCLGFSATYWSQAIIADVYALNVLLFLALLHMALAGAGQHGPGNMTRRGVIMALLFGLSLANHWPLMALSCPALLLLLWPQRRRLAPRPLCLLLPLAAGLLPYAWMVYRSRVAEIAFLGPIDGWVEFWRYISRHMYAGIDHSASATWPDKLRFAGFALQESLRQFSWPATVLAILGCLLQWRRWPRATCWSLTLGFAGSTVLLALVLGFDWDLLHRNTFSVYPLPAYTVAAIWLGLGAAELLQALRRSAGQRIATGMAGVALVLLLAGLTWLRQLPHDFRAGDTWAAEFADALLAEVDRDAALFVYGDYATGTVGYAHYVLGARPDVTLLNPVGQLFSNRLFPARVAGSPAAAAAVEAFIARRPGPIYYYLVLPHQHGAAWHGLVNEVVRDLPARANRVQVSEQADAFFVRMFTRGEPRDPSQLIHFRQLGALYCRAVAMAATGPDPETARERLRRFCSGFYGLLAQAEVALAAGDSGPALRLLDRAESRGDEAVTVTGLQQASALRVRALRAVGPGH